MSLKKQLEHLKGENAALGGMIVCVIESLPDEIKARVKSQVNAGIEAARMALMNSPECTDVELDGFEQAVGAYRHATSNE
jgi:hypothetical protein